MLSKSQGVTLIEILVVIVIGAILIALAIPSYTYYVQNARALTLTTDFTSALAFARTEALKRGNPVTICAASSSAFTTCGGNNNWGNGWIIFDDPNGDGSIASVNDRLKIHDALDIGTTFASNNASVTFDSLGFASAGAGTFTLMASGCSGNHGRQVTISSTGRASVTEIACT